MLKKYKIIYMVVLNYIKNIHRRLEEKTKILQWWLLVGVKIIRTFLLPLWVNAAKFLVYTPFIIRKNYQKGKKWHIFIFSVFLNNHAKLSPQFQTNPKLWATWDVGTKIKSFA